MLRQIKPKTARSKREVAKREPLAHENPKTALFLKGRKTTPLLTELLSNLQTLKNPYAKRFDKKNPIHPFEDALSLEFFSEKNDTSLLLFACHKKKRPLSLTWIRCFGGKILDMLELLVVEETARTLKQFKGQKCKIGVKPLLSFSGAQFESPVPNKYTLAKSMFVDFFRGAETQTVDVEGLQLLISFFAGEDGPEGEPAQIHMRVWRIVTMKSGQKVPRVEVEEIGPRIDFRIDRIKEADEAMRKEAMKKVKGSEARPKKNVETDIVGDKMGRVHLGRQDLGELQTRKMKGLKRARSEREQEEEEEEEGSGGGNDDAMSVSGEEEQEEGEEVVDDGDSDDDETGGVPLKKVKLDLDQ